MVSSCFTFICVFIISASISPNVAISPCVTTSIQPWKLLNLVSDLRDFPTDLLQLTAKLNNSNLFFPVENCSSQITFQRFLYNDSFVSTLNDLEKRCYTTLQAYVEFWHSSDDLEKQPDVLILINSFATSNLSPLFGQKLYAYFLHYWNWMDTLKEQNFPFNEYKSPRLLLLDMICSLIKASAYNLFERMALTFLIANNHTCSLIQNDSQNISWPIKEQISDSLDNDKPVVEATHLKMDLPESTNDTKKFNHVEDFDLTVAPKGRYLSYETNSEQMVSPKKGFLKFLRESVYRNHSKNIYHAPALLFNGSAFTKIKLQKFRIKLTQLTNETGTILPLLGTPRPLQNGDLLEQKVPNKLFRFAELFNSDPENVTHVDHGYLQHDVSKHVLNADLWDLVEVDGPCQEWQQHVAKLNVNSLLTAVDKNVSNTSLELFRKLLPSVTEFPIQDYNARGQLLRDLIPAISKHQSDPQVKKKLEEILEHVLLDRTGALTPKIKLECVNATESDYERKRRRTKRIFRLEYTN